MPNNPALCSVPAIPILLKNAGVGFSTASVAYLRDGQDKKHPTGPTIALVLSGKRLVSEPAAKAVVHILESALAKKTAHLCAACTRVVHHNTTIHNFGTFVRHVETMRDKNIDVPETIAIASGYPLEIVEGLRRKKVVPDFVANSVLAVCVNHFGDYAQRFGLHLKTLLPQECSPVANQPGRHAIARRYLSDYCALTKGCSG